MVLHAYVWLVPAFELAFIIVSCDDLEECVVWFHINTVNGWCGLMWWEEINEWHGILDFIIKGTRVRIMIKICD